MLGQPNANSRQLLTQMSANMDADARRCDLAVEVRVDGFEDPRDRLVAAVTRCGRIRSEREKEGLGL
eukprot:5662610-Pleurochrysis_carterae.AAC.1